MPHLTLDVSAYGPLVDLLISVSAPYEELLLAEGKQIPKPLQIRGLIDTGASCTAIDAKVIRALGLLVPKDLVQVQTPSTGATPHSCKQFDVGITLLHPSLTLPLPAVPALECNLNQRAYQALIGRDILSNCLFFYNGAVNRFALAF